MKLIINIFLVNKVPSLVMGIPDTYTSSFFSAKTKHCIIGDMNYATSFPILNGIEHINYATLVLKYLPVGMQDTYRNHLAQ